MKTKHKVIIGDSRSMKEIKFPSIHLIVTSPPYPMIEMWDNMFRKASPKIDGLFKKLKITKIEEEKEKIIIEIYNSIHEYLSDVWKECYRVLVDGGIMCINIGDATRKMNSIFRLFPNHSKIIEISEKIGFITLPNILWKKPTNKPNAFLGSGFLPTNAYVTLDCEYILIFRKGNIRQFPPKDTNRYASTYTKEERDKWFSQIWEIKGARQINDELIRRTAQFPEELVERLIKMFSIKGDCVLDPFLGTGTTSKVALDLERNSIGYETEKELEKLIKNIVGIKIEKRED